VLSLSLRSLSALAAGLALLSPVAASAKDPQLSPTRLSSAGDSITEAINAEEFNPLEIVTPNPWASWANGYYGFWEWLLGRTDVNSHNQRITSEFGSAGRTNYLNAIAGANAVDLAGQAAAAAAQQATYVPIFIGHNDVCAANFADIPTDAEFEADVRAGLDQLAAGLPGGATVYVVGMIDIYQLWQIGEQLDALGIIPCELIWAATLFDIFPCGTMLDPLNSEADRQFTRSRNIAFNQILEALVAEYQASDPHHHYDYTGEVFDAPLAPEQVSGFDCFHPSAEGQRDLAAGTWDVGPFGTLPEPDTATGVLCSLPLLNGLWRRRLQRRRAVISA
jgi:lysophospholipase L1-like esterase